MEWNVADVFKAIALYRQFPCLWDYKSSDYKRIDLKKNAWDEISSNLNKPVEDVKKKIKNLRSAYVMEKKKMDDSKKSGSATEDIYRPHLFYFEEMRFLDNVVVLRKTTTNLPQKQLKTDVIQFSPDIYEGPVDEDSQETIADFSIIETPGSSGKFKAKKLKFEREEKFNSALDAILSNINQEETMFTGFGKSIEQLLSKLSLVSATKAMAEIQLILSKYIERENSNDILAKSIYIADIN